MRNSFNVEVNFASSPLKPYEWDKVSFINGIKVIRTSTKCVHDFLTHECKTDLINKVTLISDARDSIVIRTDSKGNITKRSFLMFDKDLEVSEFALNLKPTKINYEKDTKKVKYSYELKEEQKIKDYLIDSIKRLKDEDEMQYLYYLYFNEIKGYSKEKLINSIKNNNSEKFFELYKFMSKN